MEYVCMYIHTYVQILCPHTYIQYMFTTQPTCSMQRVTLATKGALSTKATRRTRAWVSMWYAEKMTIKKTSKARGRNPWKRAHTWRREGREGDRMKAIGTSQLRHFTSIKLQEWQKHIQHVKLSSATERGSLLWDHTAMSWSLNWVVQVVNRVLVGVDNPVKLQLHQFICTYITVAYRCSI